MAGDNTRAATGGSHLISEARDAPMANTEDTSHQRQVFSARILRHCSLRNLPVRPRERAVSQHQTTARHELEAKEA